MPTTEPAAPRLAGIHDAAVRKATGRGWRQWCTRLDRAGARDLTHRQIASLLAQRFGLSAWWSQMVTVGYEQARGRRRPHQSASGFQVSASRTMDAPAADAYRAWRDTRRRRRWLDHPLTIRTATADTSLRITWPDTTHVDVRIYPKGPQRCQVVVQHRKLPAAGRVAPTRQFWRDALTRLASRLER